MFKEITVESKKQTEFIEVTNLVRKFIKESGVKNGFCILFVPHTTAGITINENADKSVMEDIKNQLNKIAPKNSDYFHLEGNSPAHIKSSLVGVSKHLIIKDGDILLGTWQGVYFCEFDGPRRRKLYVSIYSF